MTGCQWDFVAERLY